MLSDTLILILCGQLFFWSFNFVLDIFERVLSLSPDKCIQELPFYKNFPNFLKTETIFIITAILIYISDQNISHGH